MVLSTPPKYSNNDNNSNNNNKQSKTLKLKDWNTGDLNGIAFSIGLREGKGFGYLKDQKWSSLAGVQQAAGVAEASMGQTTGTVE